MTTATVDGLVKEDGVTPATPFDLGSGRVDLAEAGRPGLTFDATAAEYVANESNLSVVNYPSLYLPIMPGKVTVSRTVKSHLHQPKLWFLSVEAPDDVDIQVPRLLVVPGGGKRTFDISVDAKAVPLGETRHATLLLSTEPDWYCKWGTPRAPMRSPSRTTPTTCGCACPSPSTIGRQASASPTTCSPDLARPQGDDHLHPQPDQHDLRRRDRQPEGPAAHAVVPANGDRSASKRPAQPGHLRRRRGRGPASRRPRRRGRVAGGLPAPQPFGVTPLAGVGDETITNFNVPPFQYAGETYTRIGMVSNGYLVVGGGTGADVQFINQNLPSPRRSQQRAGAVLDRPQRRRGGLGACAWPRSPTGSTTGSCSTGRRCRTTRRRVPRTRSRSGSASTEPEDITFTYGPELTGGDGGFLTVGAENKFGNRGENVYVDGTGTPPELGQRVPGLEHPLATGRDQDHHLHGQGRVARRLDQLRRAQGQQRVRHHHGVHRRARSRRSRSPSGSRSEGRRTGGPVRRLSCS